MSRHTDGATAGVRIAHIRKSSAQFAGSETGSKMHSSMASDSAFAL